MFKLITVWLVCLSVMLSTSIGQANARLMKGCEMMTHTSHQAQPIEVMSHDSHAMHQVMDHELINGEYASGIDAPSPMTDCCDNNCLCDMSFSQVALPLTPLSGTLDTAGNCAPTTINGTVVSRISSLFKPPIRSDLG